MPPEKSPTPQNRLRSLGKALGATEWFYILGLFLLAIGISMEYSIGMALIVIGSVQVAFSASTSFFETWLMSQVTKANK